MSSFDVIYPPGLRPVPAQTNAAGPAGTLDQQQWYALHTRCRHEQRVARQLRERGIEVFLPTFREVRHWSDRRKLIEFPLFSCYVFVWVALSAASRRTMLQANGVLRMVGFQEGPAPIPVSDIEAIRKVAAVPERCSPYGFLKIGQRVRIRGGALDGVEGHLIGQRGERRLVISVDLIQQSVAVLIEGYSLEPVTSMAARAQI